MDIIITLLTFRWIELAIYGYGAYDFIDYAFLFGGIYSLNTLLLTDLDPNSCVNIIKMGNVSTNTTNFNTCSLLFVFKITFQLKQM